MESTAACSGAAVASNGPPAVDPELLQHVCQQYQYSACVSVWAAALQTAEPAVLASLGVSWAAGLYPQLAGHLQRPVWLSDSRSGQSALTADMGAAH